MRTVSLSFLFLCTIVGVSTQMKILVCTFTTTSLAPKPTSITNQNNVPQKSSKNSCSTLKRMLSSFPIQLILTPPTELFLLQLFMLSKKFWPMAVLRFESRYHFLFSSSILFHLRYLFAFLLSFLTFFCCSFLFLLPDPSLYVRRPLGSFPSQDL